MKKRQKSMVALMLACSMVLSLISGGDGAAAEEIYVNNAVANDDSSDIATSEEKNDSETGYTYILYQEEAEEGETPIQRAEITGYAGGGTALAIPTKIGQYQVGSIGEGAFKGNAAITAVTIPSGITRIGYEAFQGCENLVKVTLPPTITDWSDDSRIDYKSNAFQGCIALKELSLPEGLSILGQNAFADCVALESVTIPSTVQVFRDKVFAGCTSLQNVDLKEGIREIGYRAFEGCIALEEVRIPSTIERWGRLRASGIMTSLYDCAPFIGCTSLKKITFREGLKTLQGFQGTRGCPQVKELDIPASVENVSYAFTDCTYLEKVTMHEGIKVIGTNAFKNCSALREINIPNTVTTLQASAYSYCTSLERLILPPLATSMEGGITESCTNLRELYLLAEAVKSYQFLGAASDGKIYCIEGSSTYNTYKANMSESAQKKLTAIPTAGAEAAGGEYTYDGSPHPAVTVKGTQDGDEILYRLNDGDYQNDLPQLTEPGSYTIEIKVRRQPSGEPMQYSSLRVSAVVRKRQQTLHLLDVETEEGKPYAISGEGYQGAGEPVFTYYRDSACTQPVSGKPEAAGEYYVRASIPETDYDFAVQSNTAKITIHQKELPGTNPSASQNPGENPGEEPSPSQSPGQNPGATPSASPAPGTDPGLNATASPKPGTSASTSPNPGVSTSPGLNPGTTQKPGTTEDPEASGKPGVKPKQTAKPGGIAKPKVGRVTLKKVKATKKRALQVQWKKVSKASGYQVQIGMSQKFAKGKKSYLVNKGKTTKKTIKKLRKKKYYVRVRAYRKWQGKRCYGKWSKVKGVKVR